MHCCLHGKEKKEFLEVALLSAMTIALGKENLKNIKKALPSTWTAGTRQRDFFLKKINFFAECQGHGTQQRDFFKK
jgi:hypothetical protein